MDRASPSEAARSPALVSLGFAALAAIALGGANAALSSASLVGSFEDDAFFYVGIARHLAAGHGPTFDGLHQTNGFHPLWLALLTALAKVLPSDVMLLRAVVVLEIVLVATACVVMHRLLRERLSFGAALVGPPLLVTLPGAQEALRGGMESALLVLLLVLFWRSWLDLRDRDGPSLGPYATLGAICTLASLARLEAAVLVPVVVALRWKSFRRAPTDLAAFLIAPVTVISAYLAWSRWEFGSALPVSGLVKATWASRLSVPARFIHALDLPWPGWEAVAWATGRTSLAGRPLALATHLVLLGGFVGAAIAHRRRLGATLTRMGAAPVLLGALLLVTIDQVAIATLWPWQRAPLVLASAVLSAAALEHAPRLARIAVIVALTVGFGRGVYTIAARPSESWGTTALAVADSLREHVPPGDRVGTSAAGLLGYFVDRPVVALDGVVNDVAFFERAVRRGELDAYVREEHIGWLVDAVCDPPDSPGLGPLAWAESSPAERDARKIIARSAPVASFPDASGRSVCRYEIWRIGEAEGTSPTRPPAENER